MNVVIDMVLAEAVIALAAGAIAELQLGKIRIRPAADGAFMRVEPVLLLPAGRSR